MLTRWNHDWTASTRWTFAGKSPDAAEVRLPHDPVISLERDPNGSPSTGYFPGGTWQYEKTFEAPEEWRDKRVSAFFEGVYRSATVFVNGDFVTGRPYGYSEFAAELDPFLNYGAENSIRVEARSHDDSRWYSGAGIYRHVWLHVADLVDIPFDGVSVAISEFEADTVMATVETEVRNATHSLQTPRVSHEIIGPDGQVAAASSAPVSLRPGETGKCRQRILITDPQRWDLDAPNLYECRTRLSLETEEEADPDATVRFGIRTLSLDSTHGLRLNGNTVNLRGACVHHDNGPLGAATIDRADERRVELLKQAGFNAIRSAHQPMSRAMLDACDRIGMLVMDEAFDSWTWAKSSYDYALHFPDWWRTDLESMVRKDRNHPSVVMYSIGNEIPDVGSPAGSIRSREMAEVVRSMDPTRYVVNCTQPMLAIPRLADILKDMVTNPQQEAAQDGSVNDLISSWREMLEPVLTSEHVGNVLEESLAVLDVAGYNYTESRYELDGEKYPHRVIVGSETSHDGTATNWATVERLPHLIGDFCWTGWDYLGESGVGRVQYATGDDDFGDPLGITGPYPWVLAHAGDIDITGHRRPASYFREIVFGLRSEPFIAVLRADKRDATIAYQGSWSFNDVLPSWHWPGFEGQTVTVEVYSAADEVELLVNGESLGRQPCGWSNGFTAKFDAEFSPGELVAISYADGTEVARSALWSPSGDVHLRLCADRPAIRADDTDLAYVEIELADSAGTVFTGVDRQVSVTVDGPGMLQGVGSADPTSQESFTGDQRSTFDGRALAIIRPTGPGQIVITAQADDCEQTSVTVEAVSSEE
ncbi:glycoside hydrolase family 2 TIM barrel-domain containing protein [Candidatus Poriferisocius sp.]|uniref:glycoside hydrolase family 2 TIM barrel-domain containing protein n=1 Tax=Candidatus Poriferisocius sp. TaxID=3101276 RepID=UPI003B019EF3